jgi:4,5-dihydroxyphthalate decarboxylase
MSLDEFVGLNTETPDPIGEGSETLTLKVAMADYDWIRPLIDRRVRAEGIDLDITTDDIREFCVGPVYETFDVAEMSMSWYVAALSRGEPCIALPIFPLRMAVLGYIYVHADAPFTHPSELKGKRIGSPAYRYTVNLWLRGMLEEHYGLAARDMSWVTNEEEINGYAIPSDIDARIIPDKGVGQLLIDGEIDAIMSPEPPPEFSAGNPRIRRLFPDAWAEQAAYFKKTGIYPITHTVVMHQTMAREKPWVAQRLVTAFRKAQRLTNEYYNAGPKRLSLPGAAFIVEEEKRDYGAESWSHGVAGNEHNLETFVRYARDQGYIDRIIPLEKFFVESAMDI